MRKLFLISFITLCFSFKAFSQVDISVDCQDSWGPGRYNKVIVKVYFGKLNGFARFTQDFPVGFDIITDNIPEGDFTWAEDQLNMVWIKLPEKKIAEFSYLIKPDQSMNGSFEMTGRVVLISGGDTRHTIMMKEKPITISGINGLLPREIKTRQAPSGAAIVSPIPVVKNESPNNGIVFRVQISISDSNTSGNELKKRFDINPKEIVTVVKSGKMFKYQVGSFTDYDSANVLLKKLVVKGIKDAFIVACKGENQIQIEKAVRPVK